MMLPGLFSGSTWVAGNGNTGTTGGNGGGGGGGSSGGSCGYFDAGIGICYYFGTPGGGGGAGGCGGTGGRGGQQGGASFGIVLYNSTLMIGDSVKITPVTSGGRRHWWHRRSWRNRR